MSYSDASKKKQSRESEIALLEKFSTQLDTFIGDNPAPEPPAPKFKRRHTASETSKNAAKNFLATKTLVKNIAKACAREKVAVTHEKADVLIESLVEEFKGKYPSVTKKKLLNEINRHNAQSEDASGEGPDAEGGDADEDDYELKFGRITSVVDSEMSEYHAKIHALKKAREVAAAQPEEEKPKDKKPKRKRKSEGEGEDGDGSPEKKKRAKASAKPKYVKKEKTEEEKRVDALMEEILRRYTYERDKHDRLPSGIFETMVEEAKREHEMEYFDMPIKKIDKKVRRWYNKRAAQNGEKGISTHKAIVEEIYQRYARSKSVNGGKLPPGTMDAIIESVKLEYGWTDMKLSSLKTNIGARFTKDNPEFPNCGGALKIKQLSPESKKRRQHLLNEITARYIQEKEAHPKKMADGTLQKIIEATKADLGITEFDVKQSSIRGRLHRKSFFVQTLGDESPYDAVDEPLVATINGWLSQGISVTRAQGLDLANRLLRGKKKNVDSSGGEIVLDAKWWRNFLERNKRKLVCSGD